jgi:3-oxoadipate enol-lactonase
VRAMLVPILSDYSGWHFMNPDPQRPSNPPPLQRLSEIAVPTLIVVGERDLQDIRAIADTLAQGIAQSRKVVMSGVGHVPPVEVPDEFNPLMQGFLDEVTT